MTSEPGEEPMTEAERLKLVLSGGPDSLLVAELINSFVDKLMTDEAYRQQVTDNIKAMLGDDYDKQTH